MCTVVISLEPAAPVPLLLLGIRDEFAGRPWRPPARHWPDPALVGGIDEQAGGTWLAVHPGAARVSCVLNGRGRLAGPAVRRSRGDLPLRAAGEGPATLARLASDPGALARYDPFHLVSADVRRAWVLSWDGTRAAHAELAPGTHVLTNAGHAYPAGGLRGAAEPARAGEPPRSRIPPGAAEPAAAYGDAKASYFGPRFAASRPGGEPGVPPARAWGDWLALAAGGGLPPDDPRAIIVRRELPDGRVWRSTSASLVALSGTGIRYDFQAAPGRTSGWYPVPAGAEQPARG